MGHHISGYLIRNQDLNKLPLEVKYHIVTLKAGISIIPRLHCNLDEELSSLGIPLALISTDYFGGLGEQRAIFWDGSKVLFNETKSYGPINVALKNLGVVKQEPSDEFDTVGLGRYRSQEDLED